VTGFNIVTIKDNNLTTFKEIFSEYWAARDLGVISLKIKTRIVIIPVAIPTPVLPKYLIASEVAKADAPIFAILLPTSMAPSNLLGFSTSFCIV